MGRLTKILDKYENGIFWNGATVGGIAGFIIGMTFGAAVMMIRGG